MFWRKELVAIPPYDTLTVEQRQALYFLLEYFDNYVEDSKWNYNKRDATNYLKKAASYFGLAKKDIIALRPEYQNLDKIVAVLKTINNKIVLNRMVGNCYNLYVLAVGDKFKKLGDIFYKLWEDMGYSYDDIRFLVNFTTCRSDI